MEFRSADMEPAALHNLLLAYYREGEDADTPTAEVEDFIGVLQGLLDEGILLGLIAFEQDKPIGFVLYALDTAAYPFSERPGCGTIAEIGVVPDARHAGLGQELVAMASDALRVREYYVCAHPDAWGFWKKCGFQYSGDIAANDLPIFTKVTRPWMD